MYGTVLWYNAAKGYGFITTSDDKRVYVRGDDLEKIPGHVLRKGDTVSFEPANGYKGTVAREVVLSE